MASTVYTNGLLHMAKGDIDTDTDTFYATLHTSLLTPNVDSDDAYDDLTNELSTAGGYTSGGVALTGFAVTNDTANNKLKIDFDDPSWATATFTGARWMVIRKYNATAGLSYLLCAIDFGSDKSGGGGTFSVTIPTTGAMTIAV